MPLTREQTKYVPSNDTVFLPTVAVDSNLGVRGTSVFDGNSVFNNGINVTAGSASFNVPITTLSTVTSADLFVSGQASIGTTLTNLGQVAIVSALSNRPVLTLRQQANPSVNSFQIQNSAGSNIFTVDANGSISLNSGTSTLTTGYIAATYGIRVDGQTSMGTLGKYVYASLLQGSGVFIPLIIKTSSSNASQQPFMLVNNTNVPTFTINSLGEIISQSNNAVPLTVRATPNTALAINSISGNGSSVTYDTGVTNGNIFIVGSTVTITGATTTGFNGTFTVTSVNQNAFTVANTTTGTSSSATATIGAQVSDLTQWKNQAGSALTVINASGNYTSTFANPRITLTNNSGTTATSQLGADSGTGFVGTTTSSQFQIITNNAARMTFAADGTTTASGNLIQNVNVTAKTGAYPLVLADANTLVQMNGAFAFTVPLNSGTAFPIGTTINLLALTAGVSVTFTGGITFYATPGRNLRAAGSMATLIKLGTDTWVLTGDLTA
jgi:hypothetical protein